ncbi:MAG: hypothetical protein RLZZ450_49 [Pseudomonadota bacterium]|jgi:hypothetical protein
MVNKHNVATAPEVVFFSLGRRWHPAQEVCVDYADWLLLKPYRWYLQAPTERNLCWYVWGRPEGSYALLHRWLMRAPKSREVDHRDGNGLNCCRHNMRLTDRPQNAANRKSSNPLGRGVSYVDGRGFKAQIQHHGVHHNLGFFSSAVEAADVYTQAALRLRGELASNR